MRRLAPSSFKRSARGVRANLGGSVVPALLRHAILTSLALRQKLHTYCKAIYAFFFVQLQFRKMRVVLL